MTAGTTVTAFFTLSGQNVLTVEPCGTDGCYPTGFGGTVTSAPAGINCGADCIAGFTPGTTVTLTASTGPGASFVGWSGGGCSGTGSCQLTLDADTTIEAIFQDTLALTVDVAGADSGTVTSTPAGIDCQPHCSARYDAATTVTLAAHPAPGATFIDWSGSGCSGTGSCHVTVSSATTVTAAFGAPSRDHENRLRFGHRDQHPRRDPLRIDVLVHLRVGHHGHPDPHGQSRLPVRGLVGRRLLDGALHLHGNDLTITANFTNQPASTSGSPTSNGSSASTQLECSYFASPCYGEWVASVAPRGISHAADARPSRTKALILWRGSFRVLAHTRRTIHAKLTRAGRTYLRTHHRVRVREQFQITISKRRFTLTKTVLLVYKPHKLSR